MTVKELLDAFKGLRKISFIHDNCVIEEIDCTESGSYRDIRKHYNEKVLRVFAMNKDEIRIDSK